MTLPATCLALVALLLATPAAADDLTLLAHAPERKSAHPPLIVLLHGSGADERDMISMWRDLPQDFVVVSPRAPFRQGGGYVWYRKAGGLPRADDLAASEKIVDLVIAETAKRFDADPSRIFIGGFSQGAVMTYEIALHAPGRFRGAAVLSGLMFPSATAGIAGGAFPDFFVAHGTADTRIPFSAALSAKAKLTALGVPLTFRAYDGMGHGTDAAEMRDLSAWLATRAGR